MFTVLKMHALLNILNNFTSMEFLFSLMFGVIGGIIIGALPGFSSVMGVALLIPVTFGMSPVAGITMLAAVYSASTYGGSISAILIHTPGTSSSVATCIDGYQMTLKGEGLKAISVSTVSSVFGGLVGAIALLLISPPLSRISLRFSAPEYFLLAIFGLTIISGLSAETVFKGLASAVFGLLLGTIGVDIMTGINRFSFGFTTLEGGVPIVPPMIGLFSLSEVLIQIEKLKIDKEKNIIQKHLGSMFLRLKEFKEILPTASISSIIGLIVGILPGAGADIAAWVSYDQAKKFSKTPEKFGTGYAGGVAASEAANNAAACGALIPLLTLGIPGSVTTAVLYGGLLIHGMRPGYQMFTKYADVSYAIIIGIIVANILMGIFGLLIAKYAAKISSLPTGMLAPYIVVLSVVGTYAATSNLFDVFLMIFFGLVGYFIRKANYSDAGIILGLILGPLAEAGFRQSIVMSKGNMLGYYFGRPICVILMILITLSVLTPMALSYLKKARDSKSNSPVID